jgi:hypothetical protein
VKAEIDINDCCKQMTMHVNVRGLRSFRFRMFIVMSLLRVVAWVSPFPVEVSDV